MHDLKVPRKTGLLLIAGLFAAFLISFFGGLVVTKISTPVVGLIFYAVTQSLFVGGYLLGLKAAADSKKLSEETSPRYYAAVDKQS